MQVRSVVKRSHYSVTKHFIFSTPTTISKKFYSNNPNPNQNQQAAQPTQDKVEEQQTKLKQQTLEASAGSTSSSGNNSFNTH
jgi:TRAP-type C4-dicarboxylate transport system substrate-binding protein